MGRSKSQRRSSKIEETDDDNMSTTSTGASSDITSAQDVDHQQDEGTVLEGFIDALYEKRAKAREEGLKGLMTAFKGHVLVEFTDDKYETLLHLCVNSIKKGGSFEVICASQVLGLLAITAGAGEIGQKIVSDASPYLMKVAKLGSDAKVRVSAIESLAIINFVGCPDLEITKETMRIFWQICRHKAGNYLADQKFGTNKASSEVRVASLSAWCFLLTTIPSAQCIADFMPESLPILVSLLDGEDQAVRVAAGEAIALLYEISDDLMDRKNGVSDPIAEKVAQLERNKKQVIEKVRALAVEASGKGHASKKAQRDSFKDILATLERGVGPNVTLKLQHGDFLNLDTWCQTIQLRLLTCILREGLQRHLQDNTLLHEVFDYSPRQEKRHALTAREKRLYLSPNSVVSKARTQIRNRRRSAAHEGQVGHFSIMEGEGDN